MNEELINDIEKYCNQVDIDFEESFITEYLKIGDNELYGGKLSGSDAEHEGARYIAQTMKMIGLKNVELVPIPTSKYQFNDASIVGVAEKDSSRLLIKPYGMPSPGTPPEGITAELVDVDNSTLPKYDNKNVLGKIVLMEAIGDSDNTFITGEVHEAVLHGAAAVIMFHVEGTLDEDTVKCAPIYMDVPIPVVSVSRKHADMLRTYIKENDEPIIKLIVDAEYTKNGATTYNVVGEIPGNFTEERIFYTSHEDHYFKCIGDNIASTANILGVAKAIIDSGYKPKRTFTFVTHGSHEVGLVDSRYAWISGSFKMTRWRNPEWETTGLVDINFELPTVGRNELRSITSVGNELSINNFLQYAPQVGKGFTRIREQNELDDYYYLTWTDAISYLAAGVPVVDNDTFTEIYDSGEFDDAGARAHSNRDTWESFNRDALCETTKYYGSYGIYTDSIPYFELNFESAGKRVKEQTDYDLFEEYTVATRNHRMLAERLAEAGRNITAYVKSMNEHYMEMVNVGMSESEKKDYYQKARKFNFITGRAFKILFDSVDKINAFDFIVLGNSKGTHNIHIMEEAITLLEKGDAESAINEFLMNVDLANTSYYFTKEVGEHMKRLIVDSSYSLNRLWAKGKETTCLTLYEVISSLKDKMQNKVSDYQDEVNILRTEIKGELNLSRKCLGDEESGMREAAELLEWLLVKEEA